MFPETPASRTMSQIQLLAIVVFSFSELCFVVSEAFVMAFNQGLSAFIEIVVDLFVWAIKLDVVHLCPIANILWNKRLFWKSDIFSCFY